MTSAADRPIEPRRLVRGAPTRLAYLLQGLFGYSISSIGPILPRLQSDLRIGYAATSLHASLFNVGGEVTDGKTPADLEAGLLAEIEKIKTTEVPAEELQKVKNNFAAGEYRKLSNNHAIMQALLRYDGLGHWQEINEAGPKLQAVTAADVKRVAETYLTKDNRNIATVVRKAGKSASEDPDLAGLSSQQLPVVRQFLGRLSQLQLFL